MSHKRKQWIKIAGYGVGLTVVGFGLHVSGALDWPFLAGAQPAGRDFSSLRGVIFNVWFLAAFVFGFALLQ